MCNLYYCKCLNSVYASVIRLEENVLYLLQLAGYLMIKSACLPSNNTYISTAPTNGLTFADLFTSRENVRLLLIPSLEGN